MPDVTVNQQQLSAVCREYRVLELSAFGSMTKGTMRPDSDVDLLVEFLPDATPGLLDHAALQLDLEDLFKRKVDLVSKKALKPLIREAILAESRHLYAA